MDMIYVLKWDFITNKMEEFKLINVLELASELSEMKVREVMVNFSDIYIEDVDGSTRYTEKAQDLFNEWYDVYSELIESLTLN